MQAVRKGHTWTPWAHPSASPACLGAGAVPAGWPGARAVTCHSLQSCDLQSDRGSGWCWFHQDDWDDAAIRLGPQALPEGSGCWMGPHETSEAPAQGAPRGDIPVKGLAKAPDTQRHH